jgi:hypothetical protein
VRTIGGCHARSRSSARIERTSVSIELVDRDHVRDLHDPGLERLHGVPGAGHEHEQDRVGDPDDLDLALPRADRLEEDEVLAGGVEEEQRLERRLGEPAQVPARAHRPDVDAGIEEVVGEPDAVAEEGAARERARRVDRDDADGAPQPAHVANEGADQRRLADAGRAGDAERVRVARLGVELADDAVGGRVTALDESDRTRERAAVAPAHTGDELLVRPLPAAHDGPL